MDLKKYPLLARLVKLCDPVIVKVLSSANQEVSATPLKVYSNRFSRSSTYMPVGGVLSFIGEIGSWGNVPLEKDELAIVFLRCESNSRRILQFDWHGHFSIVLIDGVLHAIANWPLLEEAGWGPEVLSNSAFLLDPSDNFRVALPFDLFEAHLIDEVKKSSPEAGVEIDSLAADDASKNGVLEMVCEYF